MAKDYFYSNYLMNIFLGREDEDKSRQKNAQTLFCSQIAFSGHNDNV